MNTNRKNLFSRFYDASYLSEKEKQDIQHNQKHNDYSPFLLPDIFYAICEIRKAIQERKKIVIFGDYDCDGIAASLILYSYFRLHGITPDIMIPERLTEGYGMKEKHVQEIKEKKYDLVITVDTGITSADQINALLDVGIQVLVTDHHQCPPDSELPKAPVLMDCYRTDKAYAKIKNKYPFQHLSGAGIALKLVQALLIIDSQIDAMPVSKQFFRHLELLAMLATIADSVPMVDENRLLVKKGLSFLRYENGVCDNLSFSLLMETTRINPETITAKDIAFQICPIINASSRVGSVSDAISFFTAPNEETKRMYLEKLVGYNRTRKSLQTKIFNEADKMAFQKVDTELKPIVLFGNNWHKGVIGIVASKISEKYHRPTFLLTNSEESPQIYTGSCRGYKGVPISIVEMLKAASPFLLSYGGHEMAGGMALAAENKTIVENKLCEYMEEHCSQLTAKVANPTNVELYPNEINRTTITTANSFGPFGNTNPEFTYICKNLKILNIQFVGKKSQQFVRVNFGFSKRESCSATFSGIGFYKPIFYKLFGESSEIYKANPQIRENVTAIFRLKEQLYNAQYTLSVILEDIIPANFLKPAQNNNYQKQLKLAGLHLLCTTTLVHLSESIPVEFMDMISDRILKNIKNNKIEAYEWKDFIATIISNIPCSSPKYNIPDCIASALIFLNQQQKLQYKFLDNKFLYLKRTS